jgi:hypothetical protein
MNQRPQPDFSQIPPVNTSAANQGEYARDFASLQVAVSKLNILEAELGGIQRQINAIVNRFGNLYPYDGVRDSGWISNYTLKHWPNANFNVSANISGTSRSIVNIGIGGTPLTVFSTYAGAMEVLNGHIWVDSTHHTGIEKNGNDLQLNSDDGKVTANNLKILQSNGLIGYLGNAGFSGSVGSTNFENGLYVGGGITGSGDPGTVEETAYSATHVYRCRYNATDADGPGEWQNLSTFFPGIDGTATQWIGSEYITKLGTIVTDAGNTYSIWNGAPIGLGYIAEINTDTILGNISAGSDHPQALTATEAKTVLSLENVDNVSLYSWDGLDDLGAANITHLGTIVEGEWGEGATAIPASRLDLSLWEGSNKISTLGTISNTGVGGATWNGNVIAKEYLATDINSLGAVVTCVSLASQGAITGTNITASGVVTGASYIGSFIKPSSDSASGFTIKTSAGGDVLVCDTVNNAVHTNNLQAHISFLVQPATTNTYTTLEVKQAGGTSVFSCDTIGNVCNAANLHIQAISNSNSTFTVKNSAGAIALYVNTTNQDVGAANMTVYGKLIIPIV